MEKIRIGISSCLLGNKVRYDGQHKLDRFISGTLSGYFDFVPVCPEVECGLPIPRETMRLVGDPEQPRLMTGRTGIDQTRRMLEWSEKRLDSLELENLVGFIFKSASPSSGLRSVKVYNEKGYVVSRTGQGLFAREYTRRFPDVAVEDEGRLNDPVLRENFIESLFTLRRWRELEPGRTGSGLVEFHTAHKYALMAHSPDRLSKMGRLVASIGSLPDHQILTDYRRFLGEALRLPKTRKKVFNVLLHIVGYFRKNLDDWERAELLDTAGRYHAEQAPLIVPLTLINHYVRKYHQEYLARQTFLNPHPIELGLLNHV